PYDSGSPIWGTSLPRARSRHRKRSAPFTRRKSRNGGRSSKRQTSSLSERKSQHCRASMTRGSDVPPTGRRNEDSAPPRIRGGNGGNPTHGGEQQSDAQRNREGEIVALGPGADHIGARNADRNDGDCDDRRQRERDGGDQFDESGGTLPRRPALTHLALDGSAPDGIFGHVSPLESLKQLVAAHAGVGSAGVGQRLWRTRENLCFWLTKR